MRAGRRPPLPALPRLRTQARAAGIGMLTIGVMLALFVISLGAILGERRR
jgi:hypothetical protein